MPENLSSLATGAVPRLSPLASMRAEPAGVSDAKGGVRNFTELGAQRSVNATSSTGEPLTKEQEAQVRQLKQRDAEVRAHEQAHATVGGSYAGAPQYTYTKGPDGKKYATGGEVQIDTSPERTPEATIRKMDIVIRAALAPAEPSSQDRAVARQAQQQRLEAQQQLLEQREAERQERTAPGETDEASALASPLQAQLIGSESEEDAAIARSNATAQNAAAQAYQAAAQLSGG
jgi:hypothetical protein